LSVSVDKARGQGGSGSIDARITDLLLHLPPTAAPRMVFWDSLFTTAGSLTAAKQLNNDEKTTFLCMCRSDRGNKKLWQFMTALCPLSVLSVVCAVFGWFVRVFLVPVLWCASARRECRGAICRA